MPNRVVEVLDQKISELEARLNGLRAVRELFAKDPSISTEVIEAILHENSNGHFDPREAAKDKSASKCLAPVLNYFEVNNNEWATVPEISRATGLERSALHTLMTFGKHRHLFISKKISERRKYWRLKFPDADASGQSESSQPAAKDKKSSSKKKPKGSASTSEKKEDQPKVIRPKWGPKGAVFAEIEGGDSKRIK